MAGIFMPISGRECKFRIVGKLEVERQARPAKMSESDTTALWKKNGNFGKQQFD
jgi:hypothetical protein